MLLVIERRRNLISKLAQIVNRRHALLAVSQVIRNRLQRFTGETSFSIRGCFFHRQVNRFRSFLKNLRAQLKKRRFAVSRAFDPLPANVTTSEMIGDRQQFRRG